MSEPTFRILIVDDEPNIRSGLALGSRKSLLPCRQPPTPLWRGLNFNVPPIISSSPISRCRAHGRDWTWCATSGTVGPKRSSW